MEVISLHGMDDRLFELVARLVMNPDVLRQNNNYPFKTTPEYTWYICMRNGVVAGFMPVKATPGGLYLDNYYIGEDDPDVLETLITHILAAIDRPITVMSHKRHTDVFHSHGFITSTIFAQYNRMQRTGRKGGSGE